MRLEAAWQNLIQVSINQLINDDRGADPKRGHEVVKFLEEN